MSFIDSLNQGSYQKSLQFSSWEYNVDIVMCIDGTGSMDPILDVVKNTALSFESIFREAMQYKQKSIGRLRIKVVVFRDYIIDSVPMQESKFFDLPDEREQFRDFVNSIEACGGGDEPENALEALVTALRSDWVKTGGKRRHVVLLFTDASALPLNERKGCKGYPSDMPENLGELGAWWEGHTQKHYSKYESKAGRLVMFVPRKDPWNRINKSWNNCWPAFTDECGLEGVRIEDIISLLTDSVK